MQYINEYDFNTNLTKKDFMNAGFTNYNPKSLYYGKTLAPNVSLYISMPLDKEENVQTNLAKVWVLDEDYCQPYLPFIHLIKGQIKPFDFVLNVANAYNEKMDELIQKGICKKVKNLEKVDIKNIVEYSKISIDYIIEPNNEDVLHMDFNVNKKQTQEITALLNLIFSGLKTEYVNIFTSDELSEKEIKILSKEEVIKNFFENLNLTSKISDARRK